MRIQPSPPLSPYPSPSPSASPPSPPSYSHLSFHDYLESHQSPWTICTLYIWYLLIASSTIVIKYCGYNKYSVQPSSPFALLRFLGCIPLLFHSYHCIQQKYFSTSWRPQPFRVTQIGNMFFLIITILSSGALLWSASSAPCELALCENVNSRQIQPYLLLQHMIIPIIAPVLIKAHRSWCAYLLFAISFSVAVLTAILVNATVPAYFSIIVFYFLELIVVYDNESTLRQLYLNFINGEEHLRMKLKTIHERELLLVQSEELSSFYGNVAHDLKSPLQGFTIELETLEANFQEINTGQITVSGGQSQATQTGQWKESIVVLRSICSFMLMTINRAIDYSKASSGILLVPTLELINLTDAINWVVKCVSPLDEVAIKIDFLPEAMCVTVVTDKHWFMENLLCLVSNALKFTVDGSVHIRCSLQSNNLKSGLRDADEEEDSSLLPNTSPPPPQVHPGQSPTYKAISDADSYQHQPPSSRHPSSSLVILMEVEDAGGDVDLKDHKNLFQPIKQSERNEGGTGLGLYSILKRVEALGGSCGVKPRRDGTKGSRFWFSFPYQPQDSLPPQEQQQPQHLQPPQPQGSPSIPSCQDVDIESIRPASPTASDLLRERTEEEEIPNSPTILIKDLNPAHGRVLVVEDSVLIQRTTSRALTKEGYVVDIARNGLECLEMVKQHDYGFILMDIQMPVMDGIEATKRLRERDEQQEVLQETQPQDKQQRQSPWLDDQGSVEYEEEPERTKGIRLRPLLSTPNHRQIIIGISANSDPATTKAALAAGMDAFLSKPLSMKLLKETFLRLTYPPPSPSMSPLASVTPPAGPPTSCMASCLDPI
jgi:CheY-like chemotaxis protein/signal transduction histidine kinase